MARATRVLLVDDDDTFRRVLSAELAQRGYAVSTAPTGKAALEHAQANEVDVIFNRWYHTIYMRDMPKVPGVILGRRFYCTKGGPRYLTIYELERHDITESKEWIAARDISPWSAKVRANIKQSIGASHPPQVHSRIFPTKAED